MDDIVSCLSNKYSHTILQFTILAPYAQRTELSLISGKCSQSSIMETEFPGGLAETTP
jgi:hypothetical protein